METREIIFRLKDRMRQELKVALARHNIGIQHVCEAMAEMIINKDKFEKNMKNLIDDKIIARAVELSIEGKRK